ncbi:type II secretion system GspH family protein [Patescibacteria group bacterium]|nr:type II secretion system GspH family protein [Patescibacteria group bacterium]
MTKISQFFLNILTKKGFKNGKRKLFSRAFTLGELLLVIAIVGLLAGIIATSSFQAMDKARDGKRMQEVQQISQALLLYYTSYGSFPTSTDNDYNNWDVGNKALGETDDFIKPLFDTGFLNVKLVETKGSIIHGRSNVYRYSKVQNPCGCTDGWYAILYASCESSFCPVGERPSCCTNKDYPDAGDGTGANDKYDIAIFLKEK